MSSILVFTVLPASAQNYTFTNTTNSAGVSNDTYHHFGATWSDYDGDGLIDIYVVNGIDPPLNGDDANTLFHNNGDGTFTDVTAITGTGDEYVAMRNVWGDYDRDGDLDLYSHNFVQSTLYQNNGNVFTDVNATSGAGLNMEKGTGAAWVDYDNDGWIDISATSFPGTNALLHNNGDGTFTNVTAAAGLHAAASAMGNVWGDIDDDGDLDLAAAVVTQDDHTVLYRNNGDGTFSDITQAAGLILELGSSTSSVNFADYDNDGDNDFLITEVRLGSAKTTLPNRIYLFQNDGTGTFTDVTTSVGINPIGATDFYDAAFADFDNDGDLDLYVGSTDVANILYENDGTGHFTDVAASHGVDLPDVGMGVIWGDYDNDGNIDLYVVQEPADQNPIGNVLLHNEGGPNNWLQVELAGTCSNLDGIGAVLTLTNNGISQRRDIQAGSGFFSQNTLVQQFGLGSDTVADELVVRWPSGLVSTLTGIAANQRITVTEDACPPGDDITVTLTPPPDPIVVGAGGGVIPYQVSVVNNTNATLSEDMWIEIDGPGNLTITRGPFSRSIAGGETIGTTLSQRVPGGAASGSYTLSFNVGMFPVSDFSDSFSFTKDVVGPGSAPNVNTWGTNLQSMIEATATGAEGAESLPDHVSLTGNYPNPFGGSTTITFTLPEAGEVKLSVFDALGRRVATLAEGVYAAGVHRVDWKTGEAASGVYLYRLEAGGTVHSRHMMLTR